MVVDADNGIKGLETDAIRRAVERVAATRDAVGPDVGLLIECHGRLSPNMAIRMARLFQEFDPFFYEEPVPPGNIDEMAMVAAAIDIPVATGERLYSRGEFRDLLEKQAAAYIQPDLCHCGGFSEARKIAAMAETYHVRVVPHNPNGHIAVPTGPGWGVELDEDALTRYPPEE